MDLIKQSNGKDYTFASPDLICQFVSLCKDAETEDADIIQMLQSLESSKIDKHNQSFEAA